MSDKPIPLHVILRELERQAGLVAYGEVRLTIKKHKGRATRFTITHEQSFVSQDFECEGIEVEK